MSFDVSNTLLRRVVVTVVLLNLAYFGIEFTVALRIGSVSLFADSVDFLEDASVNFLILMALAWSARQRARVGMLLAGILLPPVAWSIRRRGDRRKCGAAGSRSPGTSRASWRGSGAAR